MAFIVVLLRTAWISDTAYLLLRTVEHAATGYGLRWNIVERVRVYDDPLWMLFALGARRLSGESYFTVLALNVLCSVAALSVMLRQAVRLDIALLVGLSAILSPLFVTFSTSGLEAPLLHLLLALLLTTSLHRRTSGGTWLVPTLLGVLAILTRAQSAWLVVPIVASTLPNGSARRWFSSGLLPFLVLLTPWCIWLVSSYWYYGSTQTAAALADASAGATWQDRLALGTEFLVESVRTDPVLAMAVIGGWVAGWSAGRTGRAATIGGFLLMSWLVIRGGSTMAGRDLTMLLVPSLMMLAHALAETRPLLSRVAIAVPLVAAAFAPTLTLASSATHGERVRHSTRPHDPRIDDYQASGLLLATRTQPMPLDPETKRGRELTAAGARVAMSERPGFFAAGTDPSMHVLTATGTVDPLLSRLPEAVGERWMHGATRRVPAGYLESLPDGANRIEEPALAGAYDAIRSVTRGPLPAGGGPSGISGLAVAVRSAVARSSFGTTDVPLSRVDGSQPSGVTIGEGGLAIHFDQPHRIARLTATVSRTFDYDIDVVNGSVLVQRIASEHTTWQSRGTEQRTLSLRAPADVTAVTFHCRRGLGPCTLERLAID